MMWILKQKFSDFIQIKYISDILNVIFVLFSVIRKPWKSAMENLKKLSNWEVHNIEFISPSYYFLEIKE